MFFFIKIREETHKSVPSEQRLYSQMKNQFDSQEKTHTDKANQKIHDFYEKTSIAELNDHTKSRTKIDKTRKENYSNLLDKYPDLKLTPQRFKDKMELENIHKYKSEYFERKEKVKKVEEKARKLLGKISSEEFNPTVPKPPGYYKNMDAISIQTKIEQNQEKIKDYLHEGSLAKKPFSHKNIESLEKLPEPITKPRKRVFTNMIPQIMSPQKLKIMKNYFPEIIQNRGIPKTASEKQFLKPTRIDVNEKYRKIMLASEKFNSKSANYGKKNLLIKIRKN